MAEGKPRYTPYKQPAGGWGAAAATAKVLLEQSVVTKGSRALLSMNQPGGFKCPSCAFPDASCTKKLEFCENGAKALAHLIDHGEKVGSNSVHFVDESDPRNVILVCLTPYCF